MPQSPRRPQLPPGARAARPQPPRQPPTTQGPINGVPCPHCGSSNDLRELDNQRLLDTSHMIVCSPSDGNPNSGCGRVFQVTRIQSVTMVQVRPVHGVDKALHPGTGRVMPARTIGPRQVRKLLGGR